MIPIYLLILASVITGSLIYILKNKYTKPVLIIFQAGMFLAAFNNFLLIKKMEGPYYEFPGGFDKITGIVFKVDMISALLILLSTFLFLAMFIYDLKSNHFDKLFSFLLLITQSLIIGIFASNDMFNIFVLYEVGTVVVSILIMFKKDKQAIYDGMIYLLTNIIAMMLFLFGLAMLYRMFGVVNIDLLKERLSLVENVSSLILPYSFIITAVCLKSALMPLFSWLPKAHGTPSAPSSVSGILSALYVKNGIYLFLRVQDLFAPHINTQSLFMVMGFMTAVLGILLAVSQDDIKLMLAYSTVSQIGLIMFGLNIGNQTAFYGSVYHITNHAFFKSVLFLTCGLIMERYETRSLSKIRGALKNMPFVSAAAVFAVLGIIGAPFFNGSMSKYWISYGIKDSVPEILLLIINLGTITYFIKFLRIFTGKPKFYPSGPKAGNASLVTVGVMGTMCLAGGLFAQELTSFFLNYSLTVDPVSYITKTITFFISFVAGLLIYVKIIDNKKFKIKLRSYEPTFNSICLMIFCFFVFIAFYLKYSIV